MRTRNDWNALIATAALPLGISSSAVASWLWFRDTVVTIAITLEAIFDFFKTDINDTLQTKQTGSLGWYAFIAKGFQYGDTLAVTNGVASYPADNPSARIVTQAAVRELDEEVIVVKVAKTVSGALVKLSGPEYSAFSNYMKARKIPGMNVNYVSNDPDIVRYTLTVLFNARFDVTALTAAITAALLVFRNNFSFDALLYREQLLAAVMAIPGVSNVTGVVHVYPSVDPDFVLVDFAEMPAGYFNYDGASSLTLTPAP